MELGKQPFRFLQCLIMILYVVLLAGSFAWHSVWAEEETPTPTPAPTTSGGRPFVVIQTCSTDRYAIQPGSDFTLNFRLENIGKAKARETMVTFLAGDFVPRGNGGLLVAGTLAPGASTGYSQKLIAGGSMQPGDVGSLSIVVAYRDDDGLSYSESYTLGIPIGKAKATQSPNNAVPAPTQSPTPSAGPQLLIRAYSTDPTLLSPGSHFTLSLQIENVGDVDAQRISMILGGGSRSAAPADSSESPGSAGLSGAAGEIPNFAPLGSSNVLFLGTIPAGETLSAQQPFVVNSSSEPGAYPLNISFVYQDARRSPYADDQMITLMVMASPRIEISTYRPFEPFFAGQGAVLPIQITNMGRSSAILGRISLQAPETQIINDSMLIGYIDPGGYITFDPMLVPSNIGSLRVNIMVDYLDDFNQPQTIHKEMVLEVLQPHLPEEPMPGDIPGSAPPPEAPTNQSFWQKVARLILGFIGLDGAPLQTGNLIPARIQSSLPAGRAGW